MASSEARLRVLCYDISSNRKRRAVASILEDNASRVQFSVFEGRLTRTQLKNIVAKIESHLDKNDSLRVYTIGKSGERHCEVYGGGVPIEKDTGYWLF